MRVTQHVLFRIVISLLGVLLVAGHTAHADTVNQARYRVNVLAGTANQRKAVVAAETMWTTALHEPSLFQAADAQSDATTITIEFNDTKEIAGHAKGNQVAADVLGETAEVAGTKKIVIYTKGIITNFKLTSYQTAADYTASVIAHEMGHAMGLRHTLNNKNDLMYPVNTGPNQAITHLDATKLPWQVSTAALSDLDKNTSMANSQFVTTRMSMFSARVAHLPMLFWGMVAALAVASLAIIIRLVAWRRKVLAGLQS
ncbi:MAG: M57 family metalloprotease [Weissella cibaria]